MFLMSTIVEDLTGKALSGCNTISSIFNQSKAKLWDCRMNVPNQPDLDNNSQQCSNYSMDISTSVTLDELVLSVYEKNLATINANLKIFRPSLPTTNSHVYLLATIRIIAFTFSVIKFKGNFDVIFHFLQVFFRPLFHFWCDLSRMSLLVITIFYSKLFLREKNKFTES